LYHSERNGDFSYAIPLPESNEPYEIILHMAEVFFTDTGKRVFDVTFEDETVPALKDLDLVDDIGDAFVAKQYKFYRIITDGFLNIEFKSKVDHAKVSGIEVLYNPDVPPCSTPTCAPPTMPTTAAPSAASMSSPTVTPIVTPTSAAPIQSNVIARINSGGSFEFVDPDGMTWSEDEFFTGGSTFTAPNTPPNVTQIGKSI